MFTPKLLPNQYKILGWFVLIPATICGIILATLGFDAKWMPARVFAIWNEELFTKDQLFAFITTDISNTIIGTVFIVGGMLVAFSREKQEDEFIAKLRLSSWMWAVLVNYILLILAFIFVYGMPFMNVMIYNMFTILILFIIRFNYLIYRTSKALADEK